MPYKSIPNEQYTKKMADRDRAVIDKAIKRAASLDWSKLEKIQNLLRRKTSAKQDVSCN